MRSVLEVVREARRQVGEGRLQRTMAVLVAVSSLGNALEAFISHRRGAFRQWWMWTPIVVAPLAAVVAAWAGLSRRVARLLLPLTSLLLFVDGMLGFGLHWRGVRRMPGGLRLGIYNLVMGPPLFAPFLLGSVGLLGLAAALLRREQLGDEGGGPWIR